MRWAIAAVLLTGCQLVFPLRDKPLDGGGTDAKVDPNLVCLNPGAVVQLPLLADTYVDDTSASHGTETSLSLGLGNSLLLRFQIAPLRFDDLTYSLELRRPVRANECNAPCGVCVHPVMPGLGGSVFVTRPDWDESTANGLIRADGDAWNEAGPAPPDRNVNNLGGGSSGPQPDQLVIGFGPGPVDDPAWTVDALSIMYIDTINAPALWGSRENKCDADASEPRLLATCLPSALCGNGAVDVGESCDDGNREDGDACPADCGSGN